MHLTGLKHYFTFLHRQEAISENPCLLLKIRGITKISLYKTFTDEELTELFDNYYHLFVKNYDYTRTPPNRLQETKLSKDRNAVILSILLNQGTTTKEVDTLLLQDIDLTKATIKIRGGKRSNHRNLPLKAEQIGLLMNYIQNIRPQFLTDATADSEKLFLPYPNTRNKKSKDPENLMDLFKPLTKQVKSIEAKFLNFKQIRASVITHWLKVHGLRKTQYMAGHRYIRATEYYLWGDLEDLTNDISKHHPF
jgi:integrase/recombinase XerD